MTLFLLSDLGSDPFNVFVQGLFRSLTKGGAFPFLSHGRTHVAVSLLIVAVLLFADRSSIKIGTALSMLFGGPIIDLFSLLLSHKEKACPEAFRGRPFQRMGAHGSRVF